jgi:hypothetical protein
MLTAMLGLFLAIHLLKAGRFDPSVSGHSRPFGIKRLECWGPHFVVSIVFVQLAGRADTINGHLQ